MNPLDSVPGHMVEQKADQRAIINQLGMWTLIATEVLFFGGLFTAYVIYRSFYPAAFAAGSRHLEFWSGTLNTAVLLTSSLCLAIGDLMIKRGRRQTLQACLWGTALLGGLFLVIKSSEYYQMSRNHLVPGLDYHTKGPPQMQLFILLYFIMTGLHALHMVIGLGALSWLAWLNHRGRFTPAKHAPVVMVGLYWHFVDCVWVFLYPLLYLIPYLS